MIDLSGVPAYPKAVEAPAAGEPVQVFARQRDVAAMQAGKGTVVGPLLFGADDTPTYFFKPAA